MWNELGVKEEEAALSGPDGDRRQETGLSRPDGDRAWRLARIWQAAGMGRIGVMGVVSVTIPGWRRERNGHPCVHPPLLRSGYGSLRHAAGESTGSLVPKDACLHYLICLQTTVAAAATV